MKVNGVHCRTLEDDWERRRVRAIDQTKLPHELVWAEWRVWQDAAQAIDTMAVRGAPLIGVAAAFGYALACVENASDAFLTTASDALRATRPTAVNLAWALTRMHRECAPLSSPARPQTAWKAAQLIAKEDVEHCGAIGRTGAAHLQSLANGKSTPLQILTHCNAGWLACIDRGTALAPVYELHDQGIPVHVWVDETRPRNQGASLTAWELKAHGVPHTLIADNAGGLLMQQGRVDACLVGADRVACNGDVVNKIGTYLKALAAHDTGVPFYVAFPSSTWDETFATGVAIPIEYRAASEVTHISGILALTGQIERVQVAPSDTRVCNPGFDVTPARLVTGYITERGLVAAAGLREWFKKSERT